VPAKKGSDHGTCARKISGCGSRKKKEKKEEESKKKNDGKFGKKTPQNRVAATATRDS